MTLSPAVEAEWPARAAALADELARQGKLTDPAWRTAVTEVPRHHLVPRFWTQDTTGAWQETDTATTPPQQWLERVYSNTVLISALTSEDPGARTRSSSSQPGLMVRMLEALRIREGHRVLEIGTGTGYNAALLSHRLGAGNVYSIDVEPDLVEDARARLAALGYAPTLQAGDGARGLPEHAPFDRIIATCAVPAIPWAWIDQLTQDGKVLTDLKIAQNAGSLVLLQRVADDRAEGRFDPVYAAFMSLHPTPTTVPGTSPARARPGAVTDRRTTTVDPRTPWTSLVVWFMAAFDLGPDVSLGYAGTDMTRPPSAVRITTPDGSWAEITVDFDDQAAPGTPQHVTEGGPRSLWRMIERAHDTWETHHRPGWERFGLTATRDKQTVWLDDPNSGPRWDLPS
jgi:methyltransferase of ATP-grasp peptide maturase system